LDEVQSSNTHGILRRGETYHAAESVVQAKSFGVEIPPTICNDLIIS